MALAHTPLDPAGLGSDAQRALAPSATQMMAARGLAPIAQPSDLLSVLYQLAINADAGLSQAAHKTATELPETILTSAIADPSIDARVLDYIAPIIAHNETLLQRLILNPATADATIAELARRQGEKQIDLIAQNEQRLLRHPAIIAAMYHNPRGRMSTIDRAVELAVRNQITIAEIPGWDGLAAAVLGKVKDPNADRSRAEMDHLFANAVGDADKAAGADGQTASDEPQAASDEPDDGKADIPINKLTVPAKIRVATLGNAFARSQLIRDPIKMVALAAIRSPGVTDSEAAKYASNHSLCDDVVHYIANRREWTKLYGIKLSLIQNPKTPIQTSVRFMSHLREKDLRNIARSKSIPTAVAAQARKLISVRQQRSSGSRK